MILCSGAFDGLHGGHVAYLEAAKSLCDEDEMLVCAVAPDRYITTAKGRIPLWSQPDRLRTVTAVGVVDAAVAQVDASVAGLIRHYKPRLFVKGVDWQECLPEDVMRACDETGTAIAYVETPGTHVTEAHMNVLVAGPTDRRVDERALARFETLVLQQQPATEPWVPVLPYDIETRRAVEGEQPKRLKDVFQPAYALDFGCGAGYLVAFLAELGVRIRGYEPSAALRELVPHYVRWDISNSWWVNEMNGGLAVYDLVICREVLEHLTVLEIRRTVTQLCKLSTKYVYVTTRFAKAPDHLLSVETSDDLDPTHMSMLNQTLLRTLFVLEGFKRRADLEEQMDWKHLGRALVYERV